MNSLQKLEEQKGIYEILLLLDMYNNLNLSELKDKCITAGKYAIKNSVERLISIGLVTRMPTDKLMETRVQLSEKGKKIIPLLKNIDEILES